MRIIDRLGRSSTSRAEAEPEKSKETTGSVGESAPRDSFERAAGGRAAELFSSSRPGPGPADPAAGDVAGPTQREILAAVARARPKLDPGFLPEGDPATPFLPGRAVPDTSGSSTDAGSRSVRGHEVPDPIVLPGPSDEVGGLPGELQRSDPRTLLPDTEPRGIVAEDSIASGGSAAGSTTRNDVVAREPARDLLRGQGVEGVDGMSDDELAGAVAKVRADEIAREPAKEYLEAAGHENVDDMTDDEIRKAVDDQIVEETERGPAKRYLEAAGYENVDDMTDDEIRKALAEEAKKAAAEEAEEKKGAKAETEEPAPETAEGEDGVSRPVDPASSFVGREEAERFAASLGATRRRPAGAIDPETVSSVEIGAIDPHRLPDSDDLARPDGSRSADGSPTPLGPTFGRSSGAFGGGAIDPGADQVGGSSATGPSTDLPEIPDLDDERRDSE